MAWYFIDKQEHRLLELSNGALNSIQLAQPAPADLSLTTDRPTLEALLQQRLAPMQAVTEGRLRLAGDATLLLDGAPAGQLDTRMVGFNSMISFSGLDIGLDRGSPVSHYDAPFRFEGGKLYKVVYTLDPLQQLDYDKIALVELARQ